MRLLISTMQGTNLDATVQAVKTMEASDLIAGGVDKGASYNAWTPVFKGQ
jgi:UDP-N-acetylmuramoylalanine--D-glutamate ligase